ncbi:helix-turn-helix domain-containing protein [Yinghuangia seranimata]|uniref:helix-turn-helix domain-containing protein n=1 Tax=Yinghuangia seranimata TaxID=408067 RepID=UPI00248B1BDD|nr:helix-turn-helix domain-containing protein [Yinghuangia seranimata]MDI2128494.1 helix-turn-helix domain-containing protein [Yinghuangia seranimata]
MTYLHTDGPAQVGRRGQPVLDSQLAAAEAALSDGVVDLVLTGHLSAASRVARLMGRPLPRHARVFVLDTRPHDRDRAVAAAVTAATRLSTGGFAWVGRSPDNVRQALALTSAEADGFASAVWTAMDGRCRIAGSAPLPLRDAVRGYAYALGELQVPADQPGALRSQPETAGPTALGTGPMLLAGPLGRAWANGFLAPLRAYYPTRAQDPGAAELTATVRAWLACGRDAAGTLYLHRSSLSARVRKVGRVLGVDLDRTGAQTMLCLALYLDSLPRPPVGTAPTDVPGPVSLSDLLAQPLARSWAEAVLNGVLDSPGSTNAVTLRAWLDHDCRTRPTAEALGLSVPGLRKRLARLSKRLGADVFGSPADQRELWLAVKVFDG